ncbi:hypothetical protein I4I78_26275 [Pseudonocardia sp. KRD-291]|nr:hypothetical protein [Pseudonocardia sp. KRD291]
MTPVSRPIPRRALPGLLLAVAAVTSGCSGAAAAALRPPVEQLRGGSLAREVDLSGARITVGSKEFTEQKILGKILDYALQAAGATTVDRTGLSGSSIVRSALETGAIDAYWEYAGTGWSLFLGHDDLIPGERELYDAVAAEDAQRNGIVWLGPAAFGNQYAVARRSDVSGPLAQVRTLSDMAAYIRPDPDRATFCGAAEFLDRAWEDLQRSYDAYFPASQVYQNDFALNFVNVARSSPCDFAEVFTTDARIRSLNLTVLADDKGVIITQLAGLTVRAQTLDQYPPLRTLVARLAPLLTVDTMIELNGLADLQGLSEDQVALRFLADRGLIGRG